MLYAVIADNRFMGLYHSKNAALKRVSELQRYQVTWRQKPAIFNAHNLPDKFSQTSALLDTKRAIKAKRFGKTKV